jgi:uncharacterized protein (TIGR02996 family)
MLQAFLQEITAHPEDLLARRALADWLMEQSDPAAQDRGEFIAVQLELATGHADGTRRQELERRERDLLSRYKDEWTQPLMQTEIPRRCIFRRGMVEAIECNADLFLLGAEEEGLFDLAPITEVIVRDVDASAAGLMANTPLMQQIVSLAVISSEVDRFALVNLLGQPSNLPRLRRLVLDGGHLHRCLDVLAHWPGLGQLTDLSLRRCDLTESDVLTLLQSGHLDPARGRVHLQRLDLRSNRRFRYREAQALLRTSGFSSGRLDLARRLLASVQRKCKADEIQTLADNFGSRAVPALLEGLQSANKEIRLKSAGLLDRIDPGPENLPGLLRRYFEPGMAEVLRPLIRSLRFRASRLIGTWVDVLLKSEDADLALQAALRQDLLPLPAPVFAAFVSLCRRRLEWRTNHGRAVLPKDVPRRVADTADLQALVAIVAGMAEEAAVRHTDPKRIDEQRPAIRRVAQTKESAWLAGWLLRLLVQHEAGEVQAENDPTGPEE